MGENNTLLMDYRSISEVKAELFANIDKGTVCPCCNQFVKRYERKLNSGMARTLIYIFRAEETKKNEWLHVKEYLRKEEYHNSHDWTLLKFWKLIIPKDEERDDGSDRNGYYKITPAGISFVKGLSTVQSHIIMYNQGFQGFTGAQISIRQALNNKFNYEELMKGYLDEGDS